MGDTPGILDGPARRLVDAVDRDRTRGAERAIRCGSSSRSLDDGRAVSAIRHQPIDGLQVASTTREEGRPGLQDRSHVPHQGLHRLEPAIAEVILRARRRHPDWGPRKLLTWLESRHPGISSWPTVSTAGDLCGIPLRAVLRGDAGSAEHRAGVYFRMLLIGYFEGLGSERGIAWRVAHCLSLRRFLGYALSEATPDHSSLMRIGPGSPGRRVCQSMPDSRVPRPRPATASSRMRGTQFRSHLRKRGLRALGAVVAAFRAWLQVARALSGRANGLFLTWVRDRRFLIPCRLSYPDRPDVVQNVSSSTAC